MHLVLHFSCLLIAVLLLALPAKAWAFIAKPGEIKIIAEYAQSRSNAVFDQNAKIFKPTTGNRQECSQSLVSSNLDLNNLYQKPQSKNEGSLYIEAGVFSFLTLISHIHGGEETLFSCANSLRARRLTWISAEGGFRLKLYEKSLVVFSLENNYGYRRENILYGALDDRSVETEEGLFINAAFLTMMPWYFNRHLDGFVSARGGWESQHNRLEADSLFGDASLGINFAKSLIGWRVLLLGDFFTRSEITGEKELRAVEYKLQPSIVIFPSDHVGLQVGTRWIVAGKNASRSFTSFAKIWLEF